jgi:hypothetical protein
VIDFRYHIVSLISVFLALAVGIALGAGPLKETIGDTLTGQVQQLRTEKDELRAQLEDADSGLDDARTYIDAAGERLLGGTLQDRRVAVILLGTVEEEERSAIDDRLAQSGADVTAHATLTDAWFDPDLRSFRSQLASLLAEDVVEPPAGDATLDEQLAQTLVDGLTGADPASPDTLTADAANILAILSEGDNPLISLSDPVETGADAIVVVAVPTEPADEDVTPTPAADASTQEAQLAVLQAAQDGSQGAVLADGPRTEGALVDAVLADDALAAALTTVSDADRVSGQVNVPLALAARIGGKNGHYGTSDAETPIPPVVELTPVDRTPVVVETDPTPEPTSTATSGADG